MRDYTVLGEDILAMPSLALCFLRTNILGSYLLPPIGLVRLRR